MLLAYSSGIISSRKTARACDENIIFMADTGSLCEENLKYLSQKKVDACISDQQFRKRAPGFADAERFETGNGQTIKR